MGEYITPLLDDLQNQTFTDLEVIAVDDGSTDDTQRTIGQFADRDKRFRLLTSGGAGVSAARNVGIDGASGEFLAFVDADDRLARHYVETLHESITATGSDLVSCNALRLEGFQTSVSNLHRRACAEPLQRTHLSRSPQLVWDTTVWNKLWRREMWDRAGLRYAEGRWLNDFYPCIRGHVAARTVDILGDVLYYWRIRTDPTTSITDSRLTDPTARLKSFNDRMFAIGSARRMLVDELPVPQVLDGFDARLLRSDLPMYLPYYVGSDEQYRESLVSQVRQLLVEFDIAPRRFPLSPLLHSVYRAIRAEDYDLLDVLLHPETQVRASPTQRQATELVPIRPPATAGDWPGTTPHGRVSRRWANLTGRLRRHRPGIQPINADTQVDRVEADPSRPGTVVVRGVARIREDRYDVTGDWSMAVVAERRRRSALVSRLPGLARRIVQQVLAPPTRVVGPSSELEAPPDEVLHPLVRSGWRPFTASIDLAEIGQHPDDRDWSLGIRLTAGRLVLFRPARLTRDAGRYLPAGLRLDDRTDLVPAVSGAGRLTLKREPAACRLVEATPAAGGTAIQLRLSLPDGDPAATAGAQLWLQTPEGQARVPTTATGGAAALPIADLVALEAGRYELWCQLSGSASRVRVHPELRTLRVGAVAGPAGEQLEAILRPTQQGRVVLEVRPWQLDLGWLRTGEEPQAALVGGVGELAMAGQPLSLVLSCRWSEERVEAPVAPHPDGWQVAIDTSLLVKEESSESRVWSMSVVGPDGIDVPLRVLFEGREAYPLQVSADGHPVQIRLGHGSAPLLWVGDEGDRARWRQLRKVQRSGSTSPLVEAEGAE